MEARTISLEELRSVGAQRWPFEASSVEGTADLLRAELWARRTSTRRSLCDRVTELACPLAALSGESVRATLEALEASGDITAGPGGLVAAAPLRVVPVAPGRCRVFGGSDTATLRRQLGTEVGARDVLRDTVMSPDAYEAFAARVREAGGAISSPERWSGVDRSPPADASWIERLEEELSRHGQRPLGTSASSDWTGYLPASDQPRQRARWFRTPAAPARLWRMLELAGYWTYAWTGGGSPIDAPHLRLSRDRAIRTAFALDRVAGLPLSFVLEEGEQTVTLTTDAFLPRAEYRYLITVGERAGGEAAGYTVPTAVWRRVAALLAERLGVVATKGGGAT